MQKVISQAGIVSRRKAEELIRAGKVRVNGVVVREMGLKVDSSRDKVEVFGQRAVRQRPVYLLLNKPRQTVTTQRDPEGRETVIGLISGVDQRVFPVGRLDFNTTGALLLTSDGELAQALSHPSSQVARVYRVKVSGFPDAEQVQQLATGVEIGDGLARASDVAIVGKTDRTTTIQLTLHEGRNHQIHRMLEAIGLRVSRLTRTSFAGLELVDLPVGSWRLLTSKEISKLKRSYLPVHRSRLRQQRVDPSETS